MSINTPATLDSELQIEIFLSDVQHEALPEEIFDKLSGDAVYSEQEKPVEMPDKLYWRLDAKADQARKVTVPLVKDLSEAPTLGADGDQRLNEEDIKTKHFQMEYTDISHATTNQEYGVYARDKFPYHLFEQRVPLLGRYFKQYFGKMRRQALLEEHSENLSEAPHFLTDRLGPNWFVPNRTNAQQPDWDSDNADHIQAIAETITAAGTSSSAAISVRFCQRLEDYARTEKFIKTFEFEDGSDGYIYMIPSDQALWLKHPSNAAALGGIWRDVQAFPQETRLMYPGLIGQIGGLRLISDPRYPTLSLGGSASGSAGGSGYTITAQYRGMGRADDGSSDPRDKTASARNVGFLMGPGALVEWMPEGFHWEWEYVQYDKFFGSGIFWSCGIKQPIWYTGTSLTDANAQQDTSIITPFARAPELS